MTDKQIYHLVKMTRDFTLLFYKVRILYLNSKEKKAFEIVLLVILELYLLVKTDTHLLGGI